MMRTRNMAVALTLGVLAVGGVALARSAAPKIAESANPAAAVFFASPLDTYSVVPAEVPQPSDDTQLFTRVRESFRAERTPAVTGEQTEAVSAGPVAEPVSL